MPVVISLLNSYTGMAASAAGLVIQNNILIVAGAVVRPRKLERLRPEEDLEEVLKCVVAVVHLLQSLRLALHEGLLFLYHLLDLLEKQLVSGFYLLTDCLHAGQENLGVLWLVDFDSECSASVENVPIRVSLFLP